jgi:hypothetical protein
VRSSAPAHAPPQGPGLGPFLVEDGHVVVEMKEITRHCAAQRIGTKVVRLFVSLSSGFPRAIRLNFRATLYRLGSRLHRQGEADTGAGPFLIVKDDSAKVVVRPRNSAKNRQLARAEQDFFARSRQATTEQLRSAGTEILDDDRFGSAQGNRRSGQPDLPPDVAAATNIFVNSLTKTRHRNTPDVRSDTTDAK